MAAAKQKQTMSAIAATPAAISAVACHEGMRLCLEVAAVLWTKALGLSVGPGLTAANRPDLTGLLGVVVNIMCRS